MSRFRKSCVSLSLAGLVMSSLAVSARASATEGPHYSVDRVEAESTDVHFFQYNAGERGIVVIRGDGDTDLDVYVYDAMTNELLASDVGMTDVAMVTFENACNRTVRVDVRNLGTVWNAYEMVCL